MNGDQTTGSIAKQAKLWRAALLLLLMLGCRGVESVESVEMEPPPRPNILLISIDTLRSDHMSLYGYERETTPYLDSLAALGTRFEKAFVNTHGTPQSHSTMLTSLAQETHRVGFFTASREKPSYVAPNSLTTLAEILNEEGYRTLAVTGGAYMSQKYGLHQGFERFKLRQGIQAQSKWLQRVLAEPMTDDRPIFALLHTYEVHSPYESPPEYQSLFGEYESDFEPTSENLLAIGSRVNELLTPTDLESIKAHYDRGIRYTDDQLKLLMAELERIGFLENSVVLLTSDHGEEFGERGRVLHPASLYDELLQVPLILLSPGGPTGVVDDRLVSTIDIAPTLLTLAQVEPPEWMQGRSLLDPTIERSAIYSQFGSVLYSIRTERWKLIRGARGGMVLYDLIEDPGELHDVSRENESVVRGLRRRIEEWRDAQPVIEDLEPEAPDLTTEEEQRLRNLGYL